MPIFQKSIIQKHLANLGSFDNSFQKFQTNYSLEKIQQIKTLKEEEYQDGFLRDIFVDVFGYVLKPDANFNLVREFKNQTDGKKADGAILQDGNAIAVIELKSTKTKDLTSITQQAFNYKNNQPQCKYIITSNFQKLRFYIDYANEYEEFDLFNLDRERFALLYLILHRDGLLSGLPLRLKEETRSHEENISAQFYQDYSKFKQAIFADLTASNPQFNQLLLFKKSQKFLDRLLFILFAEDTGLLPPNSIAMEIENWQKLHELAAGDSLYNRLRKFFTHLNIGYKSLSYDIPAYNGGLFAADKVLDKLVISDRVLQDGLLQLAGYDFNTELDINILGHIFEHSLNELEEMAAKIAGETISKNSKRKKDGIFYTPKYITQYIVENTLGKLCLEKKQEIDLVDIEFDDSYRKKDGSLSVKGKRLFKALEGYKKWLLTLKILDPACGSGAFLNQALSFLIAEHWEVDNLIVDLTDSMPKLHDTDKVILERNIFGVDINEESVEIAQLSLWLRTAKKGRKLSKLSGNIKCGNSLIDDVSVAGDKAFVWEKEFPKIMQKGGFDVVIGNPPYVNARKMLPKDRKNISNKYPLLTGAYDLYLPFLLVGFNLLNKNGLYGWIIPNKLLSADYAKKSYEYLKSNSLYKIVNISKLPIFDNVGVYPIITLGNKKNKQVCIEYEIDKIDYLSNIDEFEIKENIFKRYKTIKEHNILINSGTTGFEAQKIKPLITSNGSGIKFIVSGTIDSYLLLNQDIPYMKSKYTNPSIKYDKNIIAKSKFDFWNKNKIVIAGMTKKIEAYYSDTPLALGVGVYGIYDFGNFDPKFLLAILNSKFLTYYLNIEFKDKHLAGGYLAINKSTIEELPLVYTKAQQPFIQKADQMLALNKQLQDKKTKFINRITSNLALTKTTKKISTFYNFDFKTFLAELKKQKLKLSLVQQDEWEAYFTTYKTEINQLQAQIDSTDREIDGMVYKLYGLTEEEIVIMEGVRD